MFCRSSWDLLNKYFNLISCSCCLGSTGVCVCQNRPKRLTLRPYKEYWFVFKDTTISYFKSKEASSGEPIEQFQLRGQWLKELETNLLAFWIYAIDVQDHRDWKSPSFVFLFFFSFILEKNIYLKNYFKIRNFNWIHIFIW